MASVETPTAEEIIADTGISELATGATTAEWESAVGALIPKCEAECIAAVTSFAGSDWTAAEAELLKQAWMHRTAARMLRIPMLRKVLGTHEPLLVEDAESIQALREQELDEAQRLEGLATAGIESSESKNTTFAYPAVGSSTFTRTSDSRTVWERNQLTDERDGVASDDVESG
ncbi:MAG: hypothetical protein ACO1SX_13815 [Actinomycetota bacterium]